MKKLLSVLLALTVAAGVFTAFATVCAAEDTATNVSGTTATAIEEAIANLEMMSPQTGDSSMIELWLILLLISGCVLLGVNIHFKAKKTDNV